MNREGLGRAGDHPCRGPSLSCDPLQQQGWLQAPEEEGLGGVVDGVALEVQE